MNWYIDVIIKLLEIAGNNIGFDVCHRLIQIVIGFG